MRAWCAIRTIVLLAVCAPLLRAQQPEGHLALSGGLATDSRGVTSRAVSAVPALVVFPDPRIAWIIDGSGTRFDRGAWSASVESRLVSRLPLAGRFSAGLDANASSVWSSYDFSYRTATLNPLVEARLGLLSLSAGVRATAAQVTTSTAVVRAGVGASLAAAVYAVSTPRQSLTLGVRHELDSRLASATALMRIAVGGGTSLDVGAGVYGSNRLIGTARGSYVNVGLSLRTGAGRTIAATGVTRLVVPARGARLVEVAGDFTHWRPIAAVRAPDGAWYVELRIPPGQYRYACRIDGGPWRAPDGAPTVDDDFGGKAAWLIVTPQHLVSSGENR